MSGSKSQKKKIGLGLRGNHDMTLVLSWSWRVEGVALVDQLREMGHMNAALKIVAIEQSRTVALWSSH